MKAVRIHKKVEKDLIELDIFTRAKITELLSLLAKGESLALPVSRPMPIIANGVHELRIKNIEGQYRVFYFVKHLDAILVFHFFKKKTQETPKTEIETGRRRLGEMI
ncbi:MAG: type II toxin-antitoxin system RelE/ParE family toxin [Bdellovibrio sp.]|nr:type II toxin-antitoxin system RelE/ParE family toxin [Bdellovibrio sp.]